MLPMVPPGDAKFIKKVLSPLTFFEKVLSPTQMSALTQLSSIIGPLDMSLCCRPLLKTAAPPAVFAAHWNTIHNYINILNTESMVISSELLIIFSDSTVFIKNSIQCSSRYSAETIHHYRNHYNGTSCELGYPCSPIAKYYVNLIRSNILHFLSW